jgi:hypothetical protein
LVGVSYQGVEEKREERREKREERREKREEYFPY